MSDYFKRAAVLLTGWAFVVLGIVGLFLPFLQGILFLLIGLIILSAEYAWAHNLPNNLRQRFPKIGKVADEASAKAEHWRRRWFSNH